MWGLIWDTKNKKAGIRSIHHSYFPGYQKEKVRQEEYIGSGSKNSSIWDELNLEKAKILNIERDGSLSVW